MWLAPELSDWKKNQFTYEDDSFAKYSRTTENTGFYTYDEVIKRCLEYFNGDELAASTWNQVSMP